MSISFLLLTTSFNAVAKDASPIEKVIDLLARLEGDVVEENLSAKDTFDEYNKKYCGKYLANLAHEVQSGKVELDKLNATILKKSAKIGEYKTNIEEITSRLHDTEALVKASTDARGKEARDFAANDKTLTEEISLMEHILEVISQEMARRPALSELRSATTLTESFRILVKDDVLNFVDASRLMTLCNESSNKSSGQADSGQADASVDSEGGVTVVKDHSGEFTSALTNLTAQAKVKLVEARNIEAKAESAFNARRNALAETIKKAVIDLKLEEKALATVERVKKRAEGDIFLVHKKYKQDSAAHEEVDRLCKNASETVEQASQKYQRELHAVRLAKEEIKRRTRGAAEHTYTINVLFTSKGDRIVNIKALKHVTRLARQSKSISLANLASNMSSVVVLDYESGGDPFNKLKTLLSDYLTALEAKEAEEASQQVACEKSISEAAAKTASIRLAHINDNGLIEKFLLSSVSAAKHNSTLASIDQSIRIGDQLRSDEREAFEKNRETLESGLDGVMKAQNLLRDLHSEDRHGDVAIRIWENLIRSQADFTKELSKVKADEADAAAKHEAYLKQAEIDTASTASDARTTSEEVATLRRKIVDDAPEVAGDLDSMAAYDKLKADCESRVDVHDQQARRRLEIESLRTAFQLLHEDEGLVHTVAKRRSRGFLQK
jgi:hypothetical protein